MNRIKTLIISGSIAALFVTGIITGGRWSRDHVNYMTAVEDHPLACWNCHLYTQKDNFIAGMINETYVSPYNLAVSADGNTLYVVGQESNELLVVDRESEKVVRKIGVGERPHSVVLSPDGQKAYISNQWADNIFVVDLGSFLVTDTLRGGSGPAGLVLSQDGEILYCANAYSSDMSVFNLKTMQEQRRLKAGNNPVSAALTPDGSEVYVSSRRSVPVPELTSPMTEMTVTSTRSHRVSDRKLWKNAYIMENVRVTPSGDMVLATLIRPKNLIPAVQIERGWMMTQGIGIIERNNGNRMVQLLLDEPNAYYSDPFGLAISPDGKRAYISHGGVDRVTAIDLDQLRLMLREIPDDQLTNYANHLGISDRFVLGRIPTGPNPKGMALSPDGTRLYVAERLNDRIEVINTETLEVESAITLGGPKRITMARQGRRVLNNSNGTFQNQYACYTCHPDAHEDGLVYNMAATDMGRNLVNVQTLRDIGDIPPYKWNGKNQTIYKQDGMRFSTVLTRTEAFSHQDLDALVAYIITGIKNPPNLRFNPDGKLTDAQERGRVIFYRTTDNYGNEIPEGNRCNTCHPPPYFTNLELADVGTLGGMDDSILFDVPQLNNIYESPPYLHDGKAATLEEIWTKYSPEDKHGVANDMTKDQLNDLVEYLKSLRDGTYYLKEEMVYEASLSKKHKQK